jgi:hypothetical protein
MVLLTIVSGWEGRLGPFTLKLNDAPFDLSNGFTVQMIVHGPRNELIALGGTLITQGLGIGKVAYDPVASDFVNTRTTSVAYRLHFKVTDSDGRDVFFPNGTAYDVVVTPQ